jgi:predicted nuclease with TOPRIM domain
MKKVVIKAYRPRLRYALIAAGSAAIAISAWALYSYTRATTVVDFEKAQTERDRLLDERRELTGKLRESNAEIEKLKDQVVYLQRSQEIDQQACATVKTSLASLQEEVADLHEQVAFYRGIVSPDASRAGVRVYEFKVYPTATANVFRYDLVLIQSVRHDRRIAGKVEIRLQGMSNGQTQVRRLSELILSGEPNLVFSFKYFEEFGGEFRLPEGFRPTRAVVAVLPDGGAVPKIEDEFEWSKIQGA